MSSSRVIIVCGASLVLLIVTVVFLVGPEWHDSSALQTRILEFRREVANEALSSRVTMDRDRFSQLDRFSLLHCEAAPTNAGQAELIASLFSLLGGYSMTDEVSSANCPEDHLALIKMIPCADGGVPISVADADLISTNAGVLKFTSRVATVKAAFNCLAGNVKEAQLWAQSAQRHASVLLHGNTCHETLWGSQLIVANLLVQRFAHQDGSPAHIECFDHGLTEVVMSRLTACLRGDIRVEALKLIDSRLARSGRPPAEVLDKLRRADASLLAAASAVEEVWELHHSAEKAVEVLKQHTRSSSNPDVASVFTKPDIYVDFLIRAVRCAEVADQLVRLPHGNKGFQLSYDLPGDGRSDVSRVTCGSLSEALSNIAYFEKHGVIGSSRIGPLARVHQSGSQMSVAPRTVVRRRVENE